MLQSESLIVEEFEPPQLMPPCPDCGQRATRLAREVLDADGVPRALVAIYIEHDTDVHASVTLTRDVPRPTGYEDRTFRMRLWRRGEAIAVTFIDPDADEKQILTVDQALAHPRKADVFAVVDAICQQDPHMTQRIPAQPTARH